MVKTRIEVFPDIAGLVDFFEELPEYDVAMYTHKKMKTTAESSLEVLKDLLPILEAQEDYSNDGLYQALVRICGGERLQERLCDVADPYRCIRQADDTCGCYGDHGSPGQRGIPEQNS